MRIAHLQSRRVGYRWDHFLWSQWSTTSPQQILQAGHSTTRVLCGEVFFSSLYHPYVKERQSDEKKYSICSANSFTKYIYPPQKTIRQNSYLWRTKYRFVKGQPRVSHLLSLHWKLLRSSRIAGLLHSRNFFSRSFDRNNCLKVLSILLLFSGEGSEEKCFSDTFALWYMTAMSVLFSSQLSPQRVCFVLLHYRWRKFRKHLNEYRWVNSLFALDVFTTIVWVVPLDCPFAWDFLVAHKVGANNQVLKKTICYLLSPRSGIFGSPDHSSKSLSFSLIRFPKNLSN